MPTCTRIPWNHPGLGAGAVDAIQSGFANTVAVDTQGTFSTVSVPLSSAVWSMAGALGGAALAGKGKRAAGFVGGGLAAFTLSMLNRGLQF